MLYEVIVDISNSQVDKVFDYSGEDFFQIGQRVLVPFGSRHIEGFIVGVKTESRLEKLKSIIEPLDEYAAITPEMLQMAPFLKAKYNLRLVDVLRLAIPSEMRSGRVRQVYENAAALGDEFSFEEILGQISPRAKKQRELAFFLRDNPFTPTAEINKKFGALLRQFVERGLAKLSRTRKERVPYKELSCQNKAHELTSAQQKAVDEILSDMSETYLLFGVTGSGKTEVYLNIISKVVSEGKTAVMLVPEISLTPNMLRIFRSRFGETVAILHSGLSAGERFDEWERLRRGQAKIAIGARSAVFAPLSDLGVIIIDEEHDQSYQSDSNPRYDTLEVAKFRADFNGCALVMGSATPSLASFYNATAGKYRLLALPDRINRRPLPNVEIVDMGQEVRRGNKSIFSGLLHQELEEVIKKGFQAMLFINRRGFSSFVMCTKCGYVAKCTDCDVSLTYHSEENELRCHYCGKRFKMFDLCPHCKSPYIRQGKIGTQQVVALLQKFFPSVKVLRMDYDTTQTKQAHGKILSAFARREAQILVGTQMIAKGHDFPFVTLVGILDGDQSLYYSDYMSAERTFQLVTQVAGRSGRDKQPGRVVLQTYSPNHYCLRLAAKQDYIGFYKKEINLRENTKFPPFAVVVKILYSGLVSEEVVAVLNGQYQKLAQLKEEYGEAFIFMQRMRCAVKRIESKYRYQTVLRLDNDKFDEIIKKIYSICDKTSKSVSVFVQINPQNMN